MICDVDVCNFPPILKTYKFYISILLTLLAGRILYSEQLIIESPASQSGVYVKVVPVDGCQFLSIGDLARSLQLRTYQSRETGKIVLFLAGKTVKVSAHSAFLMFDTHMTQMTHEALLLSGNDIFVPAHSFLGLMQKNILPDLRFRIVADERQFAVVAAPTITTDGTTSGAGSLPSVSQAEITDIQFEERGNGLTLKIASGAAFKDQDISSFFRGEDWFYLTILGATCDSAALSRPNPSRTVAWVEAIPLGNSVQIARRLNQKYERASAHYDERVGKILVSLNLPLNTATLKKIESVKNTWIMDTIVLDAGHGGKDGGTPGHWGYQHEKDIVLDITLRLGKLLEKRRDIKVVYTRKTDEFIPLWKRTRIANDAGGKLFISLHVNALPKSNAGNAEGIELYLQNPTMRSQESIEVARLENEVIQMETGEDKAKYKDYDNPSHILANLVFNTYLHDSEKFAEILSRQISATVPQKNRGVKQANLFVLVGASMPNLLCEFGYNDNRADARKLNDPAHRQKIAQALYKSILEFKEYCDRSVAQNN